MNTKYDKSDRHHQMAPVVLAGVSALSLLLSCLPGITMAQRTLVENSITDSSITQNTTLKCPTESDKPDIHCGETPSTTFDGQGRLWAVFVKDQHVYLTRSDDKGRTFHGTTKVNARPETIDANGENRPKVVIGGENEVFFSWTRKNSQRFTGDIRFSRSVDGGKSFSEIITVNDDGLITGHRFDAMLTDTTGNIYIAWIDKRDLEATMASGESYNGAAIYYSVSTDNGRSFLKNRKVADTSCQCCRIAMARSTTGIAIFWRHIFDGDIRDHAFANLAVGDLTEKQTIQRITHDNWAIDACPHHGPGMTQALPDSHGSTQHHLTWFSGGGDHRGIRYGRYAPENRTLDQVRTLNNAPGASHPFIASHDGVLWLVWKNFDGDQTQIQLMVSVDNGKNWQSSPSPASTSSASDHPSLVTDGHHLYLSWHTRNEGFRLIRLTNHGEAALLPFDQETLQSIESRLRGKPFLLAIWSIDCAPCRIELQNLAQKRQSSPSFELILVSADQLQDSKEVQAVLKQYGLDTLDSWIFAHSFKEKIRFAIDKDWAGELPRNYLYDASGHRKAVSGRLTEALLKNL